MIPRKAEPTLRSLALQFKAVGVIGPRQSGKTTLVKFVFPEKPYINLENPDIRQFASNDPRGFLAQFPSGAIIDEAQRQPELFSYLQQILDEDPTTGKFILAGSNNFLLQQTISQSLAGRIGYLELLPFSAFELPDTEISDHYQLMLKGLYPPVYDQPVDSSQWYSNYIRTYVERDVRQIKNISNLITFDRFLRLCAGRTGQILNMNNLAVETGVDNKTISAWLSILETSYILFRLPPHHQNFNKRVVKMPKLYFYDTGLVCYLLGIKTREQLLYHPIAGALFENLMVSETLKDLRNHLKPSSLYYWRDSVGHEIDLIIEEGSTLLPIEIKMGQTWIPEMFKNLIYWQRITQTNRGIVIYNGKETQRRSNGITLVPWREMDREK